MGGGHGLVGGDQAVHGGGRVFGIYGALGIPVSSEPHLITATDPVQFPSTHLTLPDSHNNTFGTGFLRAIIRLDNI